MKDLTESATGPAVIALLGTDKPLPDNELQLGTREYTWHSHRRGQALCVENGLAHVRTHQGAWLLRAREMAWIPPGEAHWISLRGVRGGWSVLLSPQASVQLPVQPGVFAITDLMRSLVDRAASWSQVEHLGATQERVLAVLLDEMRQAPQTPPLLQMPSDRRLLKIAAGILERPEHSRTLAEWAKTAGVSSRTARRLFWRETGMSFGQWRQQARLTLALERLAGGQAVAVVAEALGYATASNFIAMFRRRFGESPARYRANQLRSR